MINSPKTHKIEIVIYISVSQMSIQSPIFLRAHRVHLLFSYLFFLLFEDLASTALRTWKRSEENCPSTYAPAIAAACPTFSVKDSCVLIAKADYSPVPRQGHGSCSCPFSLFHHQASPLYRIIPISRQTGWCISTPRAFAQMSPIGEALMATSGKVHLPCHSFHSASFSLLTHNLRVLFFT